MKPIVRCALGACLITAMPLQAAPIFINELHYDNAGADQGEAIELAGPAGTDLAGWRLVLYNGNGGTVYGDIALSGVIPAQQGGFGTLAITASGLQNGAPDGIALVDPMSLVVQFLSYEGAFAATDGPASGLSSSDIGIAEHAATLVDFSLQLIGNGSSYPDFSWTAGASSFGAVNANQAFLASAGMTATTLQAVPEPTMLALFGLGLLQLGLRRRQIGSTA